MKGEVSLKVVKSEYTKRRSSEAVKGALLWHTNTRTLEEAKIKFPARLKHFLPQMCSRRIAKMLLTVKHQWMVMQIVDGVWVATISGDFTSLSAQDIKAVDRSLQGANMMIVFACKVRTYTSGGMQHFPYISILFLLYLTYQNTSRYESKADV